MPALSRYFGYPLTAMVSGFQVGPVFPADDVGDASWWYTGDAGYIGLAIALSPEIESVLCQPSADLRVAVELADLRLSTSRPTSGDLVGHIFLLGPCQQMIWADADRVIASMSDY
jgi:hypothetical protein